MSQLVIALETYTEDGWYGRRKRYYYPGPTGNGFKNKTEANKFKGKLKKYVKQKFKHNSDTTVSSDVKVGLLEDFTTYMYCGAGPSYSCPNVIIQNLI